MEDRDKDDFKPIVPLEIQGDFVEPPPPIEAEKSVPDSANEKISDLSQPASSTAIQSQEPPSSSPPPAAPEPSRPSAKPIERPA
ncbi:MAG: hypothetical protein ACE5OZ_14935, partial [Candidatus Heimdallarchaeota archaeon]